MRGTSWLLAVSLLWSTAAWSEEEAYRLTIDVGPIVRSLASADPFTREPAEALLAGLGDQAAVPLAHALETENEPVRIGVVEALISLDGKWVAPLLVRRASEDGSVDVRAAAISALVVREDPEGDEVVAAALDRDEPRLYRAAVVGCPRFCGTAAQLDRLVEIAFLEPARALAAPRGAIARAAASPEHREVVGGALDRVAAPHLADDEVEKRVLAGILLAEVEDSRAAGALAEALDHGVPTRLRIQAILALGRTGEEDAVIRLGSSLDALPGAVRPVGCKALGLLARRGVAGAEREGERHRCG